jgi:SAM-dependent methyltransferase
MTGMLGSGLARTVRAYRRHRARVPQFAPTRVSTSDEYAQHAHRMQNEFARRTAWEDDLSRKGTESFSVSGFCAVCCRESEFLVDHRYSVSHGGRRLPNWRERLECRRCGFNSRLRAAIELFEQQSLPPRSTRLYITEATTELFRYLQRTYTHVLGSEYLGDAIPLGATDARGIRNENLTCLTFPEDSFDAVLCFEVLEHIPDYRAALSEVLRVLRPGGAFFFSAPFRFDLERTDVRAAINADGSVTHFAEPEYHGDPLSPDGILCFYHFGWDLLDCMRHLGYKRVEALLYWSAERAYLGVEQAIFSATKGYHGRLRDAPRGGP